MINFLQQKIFLTFTQNFKQTMTRNILQLPKNLSYFHKLVGTYRVKDETCYPSEMGASGKVTT